MTNKKQAFTVFLTLILFILTLFATPVAANNVSGDISYSDTDAGFIHFDEKGNIVNASLPSDTLPSSRATINHSTGRRVYYSELYNVFRNKRGHSNHYSRVYARHGSKARVGNDTRKSNSTKNNWSYAVANGKASDTFSCWYNPSSWY